MLDVLGGTIIKQWWSLRASQDFRLHVFKLSLDVTTQHLANFDKNLLNLLFILQTESLWKILWFFVNYLNIPIFYNRKSNHIYCPICRSNKQIFISSCTKIFTFASNCWIKEILYEFLNSAIPRVQYVVHFTLL